MQSTLYRTCLVKKKNAVENNVLMIGDAAGMITPETV
jgi:flavin-dependent dehydrogenase